MVNTYLLSTADLTAVKNENLGKTKGTYLTIMDFGNGECINADTIQEPSYSAWYTALDEITSISSRTVTVEDDTNCNCIISLTEAEQSQVLTTNAEPPKPRGPLMIPCSYTFNSQLYIGILYTDLCNDTWSAWYTALDAMEEISQRTVLMCVEKTDIAD